MSRTLHDTPQNAVEQISRSNDLVWLAGCAAITALAAVLRFYDLALKPLHHDEGVNGFFLTTLFRDGIYKYDPANYHGPTLYYIALAFAKVFGLETVPIRASVAIFGVLTVVLAFYLRKYIGSAGSLVAGLLLAISPGMVFISRYFIHEILFVFLSLAIVVSMLFFVEKRKAGPAAVAWIVIILLVCFLPSTLNLASLLAGGSSGYLWPLRGVFFLIEAALVFLVTRMLLSWEGGRPIYFILASASIALLFATKETAFITIGVMAAACFCVWAWRRIYAGKEGSEDDLADGELNWRSFSAALGTSADRLLILVAAAAAFIYLIVLFFSSFFTYPDGVKAAYEAYALWTRTGSKDHTQNGMWAYFIWGWKIEAPILILSAIGFIVALAKPRHRFALFAGSWAVGILAAYTIIPYKTPWLALSFLLPMCITAGYGINELARSKHWAAKAAAILLVSVAAVVMLYQTYQLNFVRYDDDKMPYVYAHTRRGFHDLMHQVEKYADKSGKGKDAVIQIVSPDYWPMVWYLKDYSHANFHGHTVEADQAEMIIAKKDDQDDEVIRRYSAGYAYAGTYPLRPGVDLMLLVRKDLAEPDAEELYHIRGH